MRGSVEHLCRLVLRIGYHDWQPSFGAWLPDPCDAEQRPCGHVDVLRYPLHRCDGGFPQRYARVERHSVHFSPEYGGAPHPNEQFIM